MTEYDPKRYIIITAVRDEIDSVQLTIDSVSNQTILPQRWIIIDDGSSDGTEKQLDAVARQYEWVSIIRKPQDSGRAVGKKIADFINEGLSHGADVEWDYWVKLDADISFDPDHFELLMRQFDQDPSLGMASGKGYVPDGKGGYELEWCPDHHVLGMIRMYRRECWAQIGALAPRRMWDVIDVYTAQMHGWQTRSFDELTVIHLRPIDTLQKNRLSRKFDSGLNHYTMGYYFPYFLLRSIRACWDEKPLVFAGVTLFAGYVYGWVTRKSIYDVQLRGYIHQQQRRYLTRYSLRAYLKRRGSSLVT
jgi:glycosyltransferase involved in cell wall biosynthesis